MPLARQQSETALLRQKATKSVQFAQKFAWRKSTELVQFMHSVA
jgi:hypothetical protein